MSNKQDYVIDVLYELSKHGMSDFLTIDESHKDEYEIDLYKASQLGALNNIKKVTVDAKGKLMVELYDQLDILTLLSKLDSTVLDTDNKSKLASLEEVIKARKSLIE